MTSFACSADRHGHHSQNKSPCSHGDQTPSLLRRLFVLFMQMQTVQASQRSTTLLDHIARSLRRAFDDHGNKGARIWMIERCLHYYSFKQDRCRDFFENYPLYVHEDHNHDRPMRILLINKVPALWIRPGCCNISSRILQSISHLGSRAACVSGIHRSISRV